MDDFWSACAALLAVLAPMALAGWLLGRRERRTPARDDERPHGKMPR